MKTKFDYSKVRAFSLVELFVMIIIISIVLALVLPALRRSKSGRPGPNSCIYNLRQNGISFRLWAGDHNDSFPMQVYPNETNFFRYFQVMSNELSTQKTLVCPSDRNTKWATNFSSDFNNSHISYFIGLDANSNLPASFLCGDRNFTNGNSSRAGVLEITSNQPAGWTKEMHQYQGSLLFADGSVHKVSNAELKSEIAKTGLATNRLLLP